MSWSIVIILIVVAMAIGPVLWLRPSPRQKQMARLRNKALQLGMHVRLAQGKNVASQLALPNDKKELPCYSLPWSDSERKLIKQRHQAVDWSLYKSTLNHDIHFFESWDWAKKPDAPFKAPELLRDFIRQLPANILVCRSSLQGVELGWIEKGEDSMVEVVYKQLQALKALSLQHSAWKVTSVEQSLDIKNLND